MMVSDVKSVLNCSETGDDELVFYGLNEFGNLQIDL